MKGYAQSWPDDLSQQTHGRQSTLRVWCPLNGGAFRRSPGVHSASSLSRKGSRRGSSHVEGEDSAGFRELSTRRSPCAPYIFRESTMVNSSQRAFIDHLLLRRVLRQWWKFLHNLPHRPSALRLRAFQQLGPAGGLVACCLLRPAAHRLLPSGAGSGQQASPTHPECRIHMGSFC